MNQNIVISTPKRTPIGKFSGALSPLTSLDLGTQLLENLLAGSPIQEHIDQVLLGCVLQSGLGQNIARQIALSHLPQEVTAHTMNMVCGSGLKTITLASQAIQSGDANAIIAGGVESMSNAPYLLPKARTGYRMGNGELIDSMIHDGLWEHRCGYHMGITAENLVKKYNITREEQDQFSADSHLKALNAQKSERFNDEIAPITVKNRKSEDIISVDEGPRAESTAEKLAGLRPVFDKEGSVTAGNASSINDGAAACIVSTEEFANKHNLRPIARLVSYAEAGVDPAIMGIGPVSAIQKALKKANWQKENLDLIELNEAFASQSLSVIKDLDLNPEIINVNGGAIALGHPIGASGCRIVVTLLHEMKRRQAKKGLASLCIGGGMGIAACFEAL